MPTREDCAFADDFSDGIWTKYPGNPVLVRDQLWAESDYICEPNILYEEGVFKVWFSQMFPRGRETALGYATSEDGFHWTKYPQNPVLAMENGDVHRPSVMKHEGTYYAFGVQHEQADDNGPATMRRWASQDGIAWGDERLIMTADQHWENGGLSNMAVVVDEDGTWQMLYTGPDAAIGGCFGYAHSQDGLAWTKYEGNPVIPDIYGGDPELVRIGDRYYTWHCEALDSLRIRCRWSDDMIHWHTIYNDPQINYTQPWERGVPEDEGGTTAGYYGHLTDATLCEAEGKVFLMYQGAQTPFGIATFDGTFADLAERLEHPPLARWDESPYGMVEGGTLKLADNGSDRRPLVAEVPGVQDRYVLEARIQCYAGPMHRVSVVMRYADGGSLARFWLLDDDHTYYQEFSKGLFSLPLEVGPNYACDADWHDWRVEVDGEMNRLFIDGRPVGEARTSSALMTALAATPVHVGFCSFDTWVSVDHVRVEQPRHARGWSQAP